MALPPQKMKTSDLSFLQKLGQRPSFAERKTRIPAIIREDEYNAFILKKTKGKSFNNIFFQILC